MCIRDRLLSENRPQWLIADIAIMNSGGVTVPLFTTYSDSDYEYIINDCGPKVCIVSNRLQYEKIEKFLNNNLCYISFSLDSSLSALLISNETAELFSSF